MWVTGGLVIQPHETWVPIANSFMKMEAYAWIVRIDPVYSLDSSLSMIDVLKQPFRQVSFLRKKTQEDHSCERKYLLDSKISTVIHVRYTIVLRTVYEHTVEKF